MLVMVGDSKVRGGIVVVIEIILVDNRYRGLSEGRVGGVVLGGG